MPVSCAVTRAYEAMDEENRETFRKAITMTAFSGGVIAEALRLWGYQDIDHMAVDHYRRKLRTGKAAL